MPVPIAAETLFSFYPFAIYEGCIYQLLKIADVEWKMRIMPIGE